MALADLLALAAPYPYPRCWHWLTCLPSLPLPLPPLLALADRAVALVPPSRPRPPGVLWWPRVLSLSPRCWPL